MTRAAIVLAVVALMALVAPPCVAESEDEPRELTAAEIAEADAIEQVCMDLFYAMRYRDGTLLLESIDAEASIVRIDDDGTVLRRTAGEFAAGLQAMTFKPREVPIPMASIEVWVDGALAILRMPYEFYRDEEYSHCGVNYFHLVRTADDAGEGWKVVSIVYTAREACDRDGMVPEGAGKSP